MRCNFGLKDTKISEQCNIARIFRNKLTKLNETYQNLNETPALIAETP